MIRPWLRKHPVAGFFGLAFAISWGGIAAVLAARGFDLSPLKPAEGGLLFLMMLLGPSVSGLTCTALLDGRAGLRAFVRWALRWRVETAAAAAALLTVPVILLSLLLLLGNLVDPAFLPRFQWPLLALGLVAGCCEEIGWTGFATPRLLARQSPVMAGLALGLIWAVWHLLVDFRYNVTAMGPLWPAEFVVVYLATLTPYRILMTRVFVQSRSLLVAILMHASFTGWLMALFPATALQQSLVWQAAFAAILWGIVAAVMRRTRTIDVAPAAGEVVARP